MTFGFHGQLGRGRADARGQTASRFFMLITQLKAIATPYQSQDPTLLVTV